MNPPRVTHPPPLSQTVPNLKQPQFHACTDVISAPREPLLPNSCRPALEPQT